MNKNENQPAKSIKKRKHRKWIIALAILVGLLVILYFLLPSIVLHYTNKKLSSMRGYYGHIADIDLGLFSGRYQINRMHLDLIDTTNQDTIPLVKIQSVTMNLDWGMLLKRKLWASVYIDRPELTFVNKKQVKEKAKEVADTISLKDLLSGITPFTITQFEVYEGTVNFTDQNIQPALTLQVEDLNILAKNLTNIKKDEKALPSELNVSASIYEGQMETHALFNMLKEYPTFDMKMDIKEINLVKLNKFIQEYAKFDLKSGKFSIVGEFAAKNGDYTGYVKPFIKNFEVNDEGKKKEPILKKAWEKVVDVSMDILENNKTENVATRVPVKGSFENTKISIWEAISQVLVNAFIEALKPSFENNINLSKVEDTGKENKKDNDKKETKKKQKKKEEKKK